MRTQVGFGKQNFKTEIGSNTNEQKEDLFNYGVGLGYNLYFATNVSLEMSLNYAYNKAEDKDAQAKTEYKGIEFQTGVRIGFSKNK